MVNDSPADDLGARLNMVVVRLNRRLRRLDGDLGLPTAQASALALLVSAGRHTVGELAQFEQVAPPTMTRIVSSLQTRGLVARLPSESDQRVVYVGATPSGEALIRQARRNRLSVLHDQLAALPPDLLEALRVAMPGLEALVDQPYEQPK